MRQLVLATGVILATLITMTASIRNHQDEILRIRCDKLDSIVNVMQAWQDVQRVDMEYKLRKIDSLEQEIKKYE